MLPAVDLGNVRVTEPDQVIDEQRHPPVITGANDVQVGQADPAPDQHDGHGVG